MSLEHEKWGVLPSKGVVYKEGYLFKRATRSGRNWKYRFFILENRCLRYFERCGSKSLKGMIQFERGTQAAPLESFDGHENCISITIPGYEMPFFVCTFSESEMYEWLEMFNYAILAMEGNPVRPPPVISRFKEGPIFKTNADATSWHSRWFELSGPELSYRAGFGKMKKNVIDMRQTEVVPGKTTAKGAPTQFVFQIMTMDDRMYNLSARNEEEYLDWLKALQTAMRFPTTLRSSAAIGSRLPPVNPVLPTDETPTSSEKRRSKRHSRRSSSSKP